MLQYSKNYLKDKTCTKCGEIKPHTDFGDRKEYSKGRIYKRSYCISCGSTLNKKWTELNIEKRLLYNARGNAKRKGIECTIQESDINIPEYCPVFGIKLNSMSKRISGNIPSIDRIDNNKGYTPDNIVIVSWKANQMKNCHSISDLTKLVEFYSKLEK